MKPESRIRRLLKEIVQAEGEEKFRLTRLLVEEIRRLLSCPIHEEPVLDCEFCSASESIRKELIKRLSKVF